MRRLTPVLLGLLAVTLVTLAWLPGPAVQAHGLEGAWLVQSWTDDDGTMDAQPGLIVFSETHYSLLFVNTGEPRVGLSEESSEADVVAAYRGFTANAGRYVVDGSTFQTHAYVAKSPNYMAGFPDNTQTYEFEIDGDTLHLTFGNGSRSTWTRVEGQSFPQG